MNQGIGRGVGIAQLKVHVWVREGALVLRTGWRGTDRINVSLNECVKTPMVLSVENFLF